MVGKAKRSIAASGLMLLVVSSTTTDAATSTDLSLLCERRIAAAVCFSEPIRNVFRSRSVLERTCDGEGKKFVQKLTEVYRRLPQVLRSQMCSLDRIFVEKKFWASGYAHTKFNVIGIHRRLVEKQISLSEWATWKERRAFAVKQIDARIARGSAIYLPTVTASATDGPISALYYVVAHELAHRIDLSNGLTRGGKGRFAKVSWRGSGRHVDARTLPSSWQTPCFYLCKRSGIALSDVGSTYSSLLRSSFVSLYATVSPAEDFAETMVYYLMSKQPELELKVTLGDSTVMNLSTRMRSATLRKKLDFINTMLRD